MAIRTISYVIKHAGKESGPFPLDKVRAMLERGEINEGALFRRIGTEHWIAACDLEDDASKTCSPPPRLPDAVIAPAGTVMQPVVLKMVAMPFGDILALVFKLALACVIVAPVFMIAIAIIVLLASLFGMTLLVGGGR